MKIALIGAGAVGGYFIWGFKECPGIEFSVIAEGSRRERLQSFGLMINGQKFSLNVKSAGEAGKQDLILIATKYSGLDEAIALLPEMVGENTMVLSLLNGVNSEERIASVIGWEHVEYSLMRIASKRDANGICFQPENTRGLFVGKGKLSEEIFKCFENSGIRYTLEENILQDVWIKYASNIANNLPQAVLGVDASLYVDSIHGRFLAEKLWEECDKVAMAKGIDIGRKPVIFTEVPKTSKYSTLQDLEAGRHTEIDMFAGHLMEMAGELGIEVPFAEYTYHAIKALEEKNDGLLGV